jgi:putative ABC transport system ATP-binding protein
VAAEARRRPGDVAERAVEAIEVGREYRSGESVVRALSDVSLTVESGEMLAVKGRSGSGKTTLLNLLGGLDRPTAGRVILAGSDLSEIGEDELVAIRRRTVSFVFQSFGLLPIFSAAENVELPLRLLAVEPAERSRRVGEVLELVGLAQRARHRPHELSGGEQQRVAIARAISNRPKVLLADEPTGQLDSDTGRRIMLLLRSLVRSEGITMIVATHDPMMLDVADRVVELVDGRLLAAAASNLA